MKPTKGGEWQCREASFQGCRRLPVLCLKMGSTGTVFSVLGLGFCLGICRLFNSCFERFSGLVNLDQWPTKKSELATWFNGWGCSGLGSRRVFGQRI